MLTSPRCSSDPAPWPAAAWPPRYRDVAAQRRDQAVIEREEALGRLLVSAWVG